VSLRQVWSRGLGLLLRPLHLGPVRLYLMQGLAVLLMIALLFTLEQRWATIAGYALLAAGGALEVGLYVRALVGFFTALGPVKRSRRRSE
jgi:lipoprotein signal peptidase